MQIALNQVAPLDANAGLRQDIQIRQENPVAAAAAMSALPGAAATSTLPEPLGVPLPIWACIAAAIYLVFNSK